MPIDLLALAETNFQLLERYIASLDISVRSKDIYRKSVRQDAMLNAGLNSSRLSAHSLRHTAVTLSLLGGATIQETQLLARHQNINTTLIYAHNLERIAKAPEYKMDSLLEQN